MYKPEWNIPLPEPLPTKLKPLCDVPNLMEDVWITHPTEEVPHWLSESTVREGIWAILKLAAVHLALLEPANAHLWVSLEQQCSHLLNLHPLWPSPLASEGIFNHLVFRVAEAAQSLHISQNNLDSFNHSLPLEQTIENIDNEDALKEDGLDSSRTMDEVLFDDFLLQTNDNNTIEPNVMDVPKSCNSRTV
ncbi:hypothetical protein C0995_012459 [Termitomyces sp. Mi166|nr:hypothetical protein C0995_012459 [Termitomyces sp. Mi166\